MYAQRGSAAAIVARGRLRAAVEMQPGRHARGRGGVSGHPRSRRNSLRINGLTRGPAASRGAPRRSATTSNWLPERHDWPGLSAIGKVVGQRRMADGSESAAARYFLLSGKPSAERFAHVVRSHWAIESADASHRMPALGARRVDGRRPSAQPQGQTAPSASASSAG